MSRPLLEMPRGVYSALIADLAKSGRGIKEAGAFLLGCTDGRVRLVSSYVMYDVIAPESSRKHAYVAFTAEEMARAWDHCYATGLQVVADVHTHPLGPGQSVTDRANPIVSVAGHVALIVPYFAMRNPQPIDLGVHVFEGAGRWRSMFHQVAHDSILLI
ncbi:MAG: Mov34/MPN/PAD-1 family protein [Pseudomonadota bacterium]|jgi:proteasome lid subunit RPN8/RPN11